MPWCDMSQLPSVAERVFPVQLYTAPLFRRRHNQILHLVHRKTHCESHKARVSRPPASASAATSHADVPATSGPPWRAKADFEAVCPICLETKFSIHTMQDRSRKALFCGRCSRAFTAKGDFVDLTPTSGVDMRVYNQKFWAGTEIFRNPLVSFVYERGWRQGFTWGNFPGVEKELQMALEYLQPAYGETIVDMSCGSGLFSRRFVASGKFAGVIAADFSEAMLGQTAQFFREDAGLDPSRYALVRTDVGRMPFATGSLAAVHAGAALHCWPSPLQAMAEISRVLRPEGVFVASTFLTAAAPLGALLGDDAVRPLAQLDPLRSRQYKWWEEAELRELAAAVGLQSFQRHRQGRFILFSVRKPAAYPPSPKL